MREDIRGPGRGAEKEAAAEETSARDPNPGPPRSPPWVTRQEGTTFNMEKDPRNSGPKKHYSRKERTGTSLYWKKPRDRESSKKRKRRGPTPKRPPRIGIAEKM